MWGITMRLTHPHAEAASLTQSNASARRLEGPWLTLTRVVCALVALLTVGSFIVGLSQRFAQVNTLSDTDVPNGWTPEAFQTALTQLGLSIGAYHTYRLALDLTFALCFFTVAAVLLWRNSNDWMALFAALALLSFGALWPTNTDELARAYPAWAWLFTVEDQLSLTFLLVFLCLYPTGRFVPRWLGWLLVIWVASGIVGALAPSLPDELNVLQLLGFLGVALVAQVYRYRRRSDAIQRQQIKWLVFGFGLTLALVVALLALGAIFPSLDRPGTAGLLYEAAGAAIGAVLFLPIPLCVSVALLRYRLWDVDILINRTLVYGALTACVVGIYILVVGYLGALFRTSGNLAISLLATGVVALLFQPLRGWFQRGVNRLLYGQRDEPYLVVTHLSQRVESSLTHETILPTIVETVAQALKLPYAAITLREGEERVVAATYGTANGDGLRLPLIYQAEPIGELILSPRAPGDAWTPADRRLLDEVARQAGMAAHAVQLTGDLQRSRERLVLAREEERRRLRRDLHDGLGPTLGNLTLQLDAVDDLIESDPLAAHELVMKVKRQTQLAIGEIRRLVDDLRPPALDELGLVTALREQAAHYNQLGALLVEMDAPDTLPSLPAAVEVAAYRIAVEGLRNSARHAEARRCAIHLRLEDGLIVEIVDDGKGLSAQAHRGVGIDSMRERAAELGGTCVVETASQGGVRVFARLPLAMK
jgi:signal transduction histidine kinase